MLRGHHGRELNFHHKIGRVARRRECASTCQGLVAWSYEDSAFRLDSMSCGQQMNHSHGCEQLLWPRFSKGTNLWIPPCALEVKPADVAAMLWLRANLVLSVDLHFEVERNRVDRNLEPSCTILQRSRKECLREKEARDPALFLRDEKTSCE